MNTITSLSIRQIEQQFSVNRHAEHAAYFEDDFAVFTDVHNLVKGDEQVRLDMSVYALCLNGRATIEINLNKHHVEANDYLVLQPSQLFRLTDISDDFHAIFICASRRISAEVLLKLSEGVPMFFYFRDHPCARLAANDVRWIQMYHDLLFDVLSDTTNPFRREAAYGLTIALIYKSCNIFSHVHQRTEPRQLRSEELFEQFLTLLQSYYLTERSISFYADKICITPKYLSMVVKQVSGKSANEWIDDYVMLEAKLRLRTTHKSVSIIAEELGFSNQSFFGKFFKHHTGMSPLTYRRTQK